MCCIYEHFSPDPAVFMPAYVVWLTYICRGFVLHKFSVPRPREATPRPLLTHAHCKNQPPLPW